MLILLFLSILIANAAPDLSELDQFFAADSFAESFQINDRIEFTSESCVMGQCDKPTYESFVETVDESQVSLHTRGHKGSSEGHSVVLTQDVWNRGAHNRVRLKIESMESFGFEVKSLTVTPGNRTVMIDGSAQIVETRIVIFNASNPVGITLNVTMEVAAGVNGLAQILYSMEEKSLGVDTMEVQEVFSGKP